MKKIDLETATREFFAFRPDDAYSFEEVCGQFKRWNARAYRCKRGEVCVTAGVPAREFLAVASGALHVRVSSEIGEDILLRAVRPGEFVGLTHVFSSQETYEHDVIAAAETVFLSFSVSEVRKWRTDPKSQPLYDFLGRRLSEICREAQTKAMILSGSDIAERLRRYLSVRMQKEGTRTVVCPGTGKDLADYLGVNRCALSRVIGKLRAEGKLDVRGNVFTVL